MIYKLILPFIALAIGLAAGILYEAERSDIEAAVLMTANAHSNFKYQLDVYEKLDRLLAAGNVSKAQQVVSQQTEHVAYMIANAESFCEDEGCNAETRAYLERAFEASNK